MLVEFETIRSCSKESHELNIKKETTGIASVPFEREQDYKTKMTIELDNIKDFTGGRVFFNNQRLDCVYAYNQDNEITSNILISYEDFKKLIETQRSIKILNHLEV